VPRHAAAQARKTRLNNALKRLAALYPYGALMLEMMPAELLEAVCDEVEARRRGEQWDPNPGLVSDVDHG
jgi:hypothetical protein